MDHGPSSVIRRRPCVVRPSSFVCCAVLALALLAHALPANAAVPTPAPAPGTAPTSAPAPAGGGLAPAPSAPASGPAKSHIAGEVLLDEDLSGGPSYGDRPLIGVTVRIVGPGLNTATSTGGNGTFVFDGLPAGAYTISIGLPGGVVSLNGTSRLISVDGRSSARADFFVARSDRVPTPTPLSPTPTPEPTATPLPTATPKPLPTPVAAPGYVYPEPPEGAGSSGAPSRSVAAVRAPAASTTTASQYPLRPIVTSLQGLRYAASRGNPSAVQTVETETMLWLGIPFMTQLDGTAYSGVNCGPASIAMVLGAFGIRAGPAYIRDYVNYISGVYSQNVGTSLDHLSRVVLEAGLEVTNLYSGSGYLRWNTDMLREEVRAGRPVVTLVRYRALPGHGGSLADTDHYIVISGLSGNDFIYNDAAFGGERGYGLLISPGGLDRAWSYSSIPRHGMSVGLSAEALARLAAERAGQAEAAAGSVAEEEMLAESDVDLGEEVGFLDSFTSLLFQRILVDAQPGINDPAALGGLELAEFMSFEPTDGTADSRHAEQAFQARFESVDPAGPLTDFAVPLAWLSLGLLGLFVGAGTRRVLQ